MLSRHPSKVVVSSGLAGLMACALLVLACAPPPAPTATAVPAKPAAPTVPAAAPTVPAAAPAKPAAEAAPTAKPAVDAKPAAIDYKAELNSLYEAAKKEGVLSLYSSMNLDDAKVVLPEFEKAYPGIKVDHVRATGEALQQRLGSELKGGKVLADVFDTNAAQYLPLMQAGYMDAYPVPAAQDLPTTLRDEKGLWTSQRVTTVMVAYNTSQLGGAEPPRTFEDLANPKWKGKMLMEVADQEMFITLLKQKFASEEQGLEVFRKIAANEPEVHAGHTQVADLLAAGQGAVCMGCYGHHIIALKAKGAPVEFAKTEGVLYNIVFGLVKGAPHPNAAKLYLNWTISPEGQKVLGAAGRAPSRPGTPISTPLMPDGIKWYPSRPEYTAEFDKYDALWREIFKIRG